MIRDINTRLQRDFIFFIISFSAPSPNIQKLRIYVAKSNVFTISKANKWGMDPEFNVSMREYPQLSLTTIGLNLTF
ncbi:MAG: hypothetical protein J0H29_00390 [Sphingobacteriales bacterium]|nr:hypothetical protein [Sphingobacteriales bacterium]